MTASVLIGNSDNKLTQLQWHNFCHDVQTVVKSYASTIYFSGGSASDSVYQNYCVVFDYDTDNMELLKLRLDTMKYIYNQESIAFVIGQTIFI